MCVVVSVCVYVCVCVWLVCSLSNNGEKGCLEWKWKNFLSICFFHLLSKDLKIFLLFTSLTRCATNAVLSHLDPSEGFASSFLILCFLWY